MIESPELVVLLALLNPVHLSSSLDKRLWSLDSSGLFTCKSFFQYLTHSSNTTSLLLDEPIWKSKAPFEVKSFIWTDVFNRINTNDILQFEDYIRLFPLMCVMYGMSSESVSHLFLHCPMVVFLWNTLFGIFGKWWVSPATLDQLLLISFAGFGRRKEAKLLWQCAIYATVWSIWLKRNSCIFNDRFSYNQVLWDRVRCFASIWCKACGLFRGISLSSMLRDWKAKLHL